MNFSLRAFGHNEGVRITQEEFAELASAKRTTLQCLRVEEKFDVLMENYVELERTLFQIAMDHLAFAHLVTDELHLRRNLVSRRLMNLFSSMHLYRNALKRQSSKILSRSEGAETMKRALDDSVEQPMAFRLIQVVRNYSQHDELPLSSLSVGGRRTGGKDTERDGLAYSVTPKIDGPAIAAQRRGIPDDIRDALSQLGPKAEVMPLVRKSLERWGEIHKLFRDEVKSLATSAEELIRSAFAKVRADGQEPVSLVFLFRCAGDDDSEEIQLFEELFTQLDYLRKKNRSQANLSLRYVEWSKPPWGAAK